MSEWKAKRFWTDVHVRETEDGYEIHLDQRVLKTPSKQGLTVPTRALASKIADEWSAQEKEINPLSMPYTRSVNSAIDKVRPQRAEIVDLIADYGDSDLLCYRADSPLELVERQGATWDPILQWAKNTFGVTLVPRTGVIHAAQDPKALAVLKGEVAALDEFQLVAFHDLVSLSGSLVIGLAALKKSMDIGDLWVASRLDELWQQEQWGIDDEAEIVANRKRDDFFHAANFTELCKLS